MRAAVLGSIGSIALLFASCSESTPGSSASNDASVTTVDTGTSTPTDSAAGIDSASATDAGSDVYDAQNALDAPDGANADAADAADAPAETSADAAIPASTSTFEESLGANTYYGGLSAGNWVASGVYAPSHSGSQYFGSGNGNASGTFPNIGIKKTLGGIVENRPYTVSFYVVQDLDGLSGIELSDFSKLRIGGPDGSVVWTSTPQPTVVDAWVQWTGTYTPAPADVGGPFYFEAIFDLDGMHSIGIDGPILAVP
jgi:hypothetical protein